MDLWVRWGWLIWAGPSRLAQGQAAGPIGRGSSVSSTPHMFVYSGAQVGGVASTWGSAEVQCQSGID